ncbi:sensor histidine kinase [Brevibacillus ginsengisoli]|uniref:sensor histidine kinase n=1 Tax=Brevibacillus ginsengisoli TaxID=363854 RepID=UPI003CFB68FE
MKHDWFKRIKNWKKDMFVQTENRLVVQYSGIIMIFLVLFITLVYFLVNTVITFDQEKQLHLKVDQGVTAIKDSLLDQTLTPQEVDDIRSLLENSSQSFYYVVGSDGQLLIGNTFIPRVQKDLLQRLKGWTPTRQEIRYETMTLPSPPKHGRRYQSGERGEREIRLMITGQAIYQGNQLVAIFYTGRDITFLDALLHRLLTVLIAIGIVFLGIAIYLSYYMSKRAMIPIRKSFQRQREFVADASHELRTPLSILNSSLEVLELEDGENLSAYSRNTLFYMKDEVRRMTTMVGDLLMLARSDTEYPDLKIENFDIVTTIVQIVNSTQSLVNSKGLYVQLQTPAELIIQGDQERLKQLLYILLDNAIKYTPTGGQITLSAALETPFIRMTVQDTGVGIPHEAQARIFERFYRVDKNRSRQMGGTGLGLSIAKWIVDAHHGKIEVFSELEKGSTFTVRIPVEQKQA